MQVFLNASHFFLRDCHSQAQPYAKYLAFRRESVTPDNVVARIDPQELIDLALALGNIDSPTGAEGPAGQFVYDWLARNGFEPKKYALVEERFNVAAWLDGSGGGYNLIFNSHLDTTLRPDAVWSARDPRDPLYLSAWVEGDEIFGDGVVNDKGPMAAFLIAAKAIKDSEFPLRGDLIVSAVAGEISREPVDEFQGWPFLSKDLGVRFMVTHGAVADFALVAEGTGFGIVWIEPGKAHFKVTVYSDQPRYYSPYLPRAGRGVPGLAVLEQGPWRPVHGHPRRRGRLRAGR